MARKVMVELVGDERSLQRAFRRGEADATRFQARMRRISRTSADVFGARGFGAFAAGGGVAVGLGVALHAATDFADAASDMAEAVGKTDVVFGDSAKAVEAWAKTTTEAFAVSQRQALETASSFGALLAPLGIVGDEAAQLSEKLTGLGADLSSFYNAPIADALDAIRSGLVGESEPLRRFGVLLSEARVQQEAMRESGKSSATQLTQTEKVLARINLIFRDSVQAQGDSARSMGRYAEQTKKLAAQLDDAKVALGEFVVPALTTAITTMNDAISAAHGLADAFERLGSIKLSFPGLPDAISPTLGSIATAAGQGILDSPFIAPSRGLAKWLERFLPFKGTPVPLGVAGRSPFSPTETLRRAAEAERASFTARLQPLSVVKQLSVALQTREVNARLRGSTKALRAVLVDQTKFLRDAIVDGFGLSPAELLSLKQALLSITGEIQSIDEQAAATRKAAIDDAKQAAREAAEKRRRAATRAREKAREAAAKLKLYSVPLALEVAQAQAEALGRDVKPILEQIRKSAKKALESGRLGLQGQLDAWNTIANVNEQLKNQADALQKFIVPSTKKLVESLKLSPRDRAILRQRLAQLGPGGTLTVPGQTAAFGYAMPGGMTFNGATIYVQGVQNIKDLENQLTKERNRSRTGTRRGTYGGRH